MCSCRRRGEVVVNALRDDTFNCDLQCSYAILKVLVRAPLVRHGFFKLLVLVLTAITVAVDSSNVDVYADMQSSGPPAVRALLQELHCVLNAYNLVVIDIDGGPGLGHITCPTQFSCVSSDLLQVLLYLRQLVKLSPLYSHHHHLALCRSLKPRDSQCWILLSKKFNNI